MKVAVVGATGLVGEVMRHVLAEREIPVTALIPVASERSVGKQLEWQGKTYTVHSLEQAVTARPDVALFSAGGGVSLEWAPKFTEVGTIVIDNSSAWRMTESVPLLVPEVNMSHLEADDFLIANPNCSTIQMVAALAPLHRRYTIRRLVISTYQSITGTGVKAVQQYEAEKSGAEVGSYTTAYPHPIAENVLPHCDVFLENDYTREEMKLVHETRKILGAPHLAITATAVRVPVQGGHSESVNVEFEQEYDLAEVKQMLRAAPGIVVQDDPAANSYPMPLPSRHRDEVFVGRIRRDESQPRTLNLWIVADNLRKGAATNAVQILEELIRMGRV